MSSKFYTQPVKEVPLWEDRRRKLPFGLPWSFTKYILTDMRLKVNNGFLKRREETLQLYRITDITLTRTLGERICGTGTVTVIANDASSPKTVLRHVKHPTKVRDLLLQSVETARKAAGVTTSEIVGGGMRGPVAPPPGGGQSAAGGPGPGPAGGPGPGPAGGPGPAPGK